MSNVKCHFWKCKKRVHNHKCCERFKEFFTEIWIYVASCEDMLEGVLGVARFSLGNWWVSLVFYF